MNKLAVLTLLASAIGFSSTLYAKDGDINFTGSILDKACTVSTKNIVVPLGNIASSSFAAAGSTAASTRFTIELTDCPVSVTSATIRFDGTPNSTNSNILGLTTGQTATNVGVALYEQDSTQQINLGSSSANVALNPGVKISLPYVAKYMATAVPVGAGTANSTASFTVIYN